MVNESFLCKKDVESCNHIILWCPFVYKLWTLAYGLLDFNWVMTGLVRKEIKKHGRVLLEWRDTHSLAIIWVVWKEKNKRAFEGVEDGSNRVKYRWQTLGFFILGHLVHLRRILRTTLTYWSICRYFCVWVCACWCLWVNLIILFLF